MIITSQSFYVSIKTKADDDRKRKRAADPMVRWMKLSLALAVFDRAYRNQNCPARREEPIQPLVQQAQGRGKQHQQAACEHPERRRALVLLFDL